MPDDPQGPVTIVATFHIQDEHAEEVLAAIAACIRASRQEAANLSYTCRRDIHDPLHLVFVEQWKSLAAIEDHERQPHFLAMKAMFDQGKAGPLSVTLLQDVPALA
ncbi:Antibiotic biosynthesis monooxygenase [Gluconacetobacter diazotrophicus PA1 5]|uniref:Antibiotic biosynthesis monooxygenase n=2 Tax=Gluconacetobacter diazotrophicus TaxID=33996 RepID=A0A7W4FCA2_GLUDI|nr:putative quinol monooxygenase [Gluconacetobacter diazotrophicus]ACI51181.1 Antibiotic biosynthesis monooxygenase [Gluconacetobacter diazotrophicus PA1 5]MBB2155106.1 antibiotic biosynthesis monooxygenase [Gluconacetobacter diazotrophicus]TWB09737.1 quinol monooxygenase YgiN [Gluconacetobacter diazotrophicus]CAP54542.1 putative antibiotic biosynthesis monooxygenase [Gluconacetobacter diazotrophicus PA1 5]